MVIPSLSMLWESTVAAQALAQRFRFASPEEASAWLAGALLQTHGLQVVAVNRLVISSYNLLAWLETTNGPLIAKCCALAAAHPQLLALGELMVWLAGRAIPVSVPLPARTGEMQVVHEHLSLGVQRLIPGVLLEPGDPAQAYSAGVTLARLHNALAVYPGAGQFARWPAMPGLKTAIQQWAQQKQTAIYRPVLADGVQTLLRRLNELEPGPLPMQAVHNDYRAANILWNEGAIYAVLDFEELRWGCRVNDLAWAAVHLGTRYHHWGPVSLETQRTFLRGYREVQILTTVEEAWLPLLMAWHSINLAYMSLDSPTGAAALETAGASIGRLETVRTGT